MESLDSLKRRLAQKEEELSRITVRRSGTAPWAPGVQDSFHSESYSYEDYTDTSKAYRLKSEIKELRHEIDTYAYRAAAERASEEAARRRSQPEYTYEAGGKKETTTNPAIAARYDAQKRFFAMTKTQQTLAKITGQWKKFDKLWKAAVTRNPEQQQEIAASLDKLFK